MMTFLKTTLNKIKSKILSNKKAIILGIISFFLFILLFLESGYSLYANLSERAKILILISLVGTTVTLLLLLFDYTKIFYLIKQPFVLFKVKVKVKVIFKKICKAISIEFYISFFFIVFFLLSLFFNKNISANLNSYLMAFSILILSFLLSKIFSFQQFARAFVKIMLMVSIASLLINCFYLIAETDISTTVFSTIDGSRKVTSFFFFFIKNIAVFNQRMQGPFWEPGVFSTMIMISMLLYHFFVNKRKLFIPIVFTICILFTQSTAGIILTMFVWLIILFDLFKTSKAKTTLFLVFIGFFFIGFLVLSISPLFDFVAKLAPTLFSKFETISFASRYNSLVYGFKIFGQSPLFGVGASTARDMFFSLTSADGVLADAFTSTLGALAASYGISGILFYLLPIIGLLFNKNLTYVQKIMLCIFYFLTTLQENQFEIFMLSILYIMLGFYGVNDFLKRTKTKSLYSIDDKQNCLFNLFFKNSETGNVSSNLALNAVIKVFALLIGFITISIYSGYFGNKSAYGIWLSIISISTWILQLDFGFGNGLRNKLTEARIQKDKKKERALISSTYFTTFCMSIIWIIAAIVLCNTLDLTSIFKASSDYVSNDMLKFSVMIVLISIAIELSLRNITFILQVIGKSGIASSLTLISNIFILIFASAIRIDGESKFIVLSIVYSISILLPLIIVSIIVFSKRDVPFINFHSITKEAFRSIFKLGMGFFVVQISNLFLWPLNELFLINLLNRPDVVVDYTVYYKIFTAITGLIMIMQGPVWVGISAAKAKNDLRKMKKYFKILFIACASLALCSLFVAFGLPLVFRLWLGDANMPEVKPLYQIIMALFSLVTFGYEFFGLICNGLGAVKSQAIVAIITVALKVPLALLLNFLFGKYLNWSVVILSNTILISIYLFVLPFIIKKELKLIADKQLLKGQ